MKPFLTTINEKLSTVVYHKTFIDNALGILKDNEFILTSTVAREVGNRNPEAELVSPRKGKGNFYFLSTARTKTSSYIKSISTWDVVFTLDGDALSNNYRAEPVDYFNKSPHRSSMSLSQRSFQDEQEDRLVSEKPRITNASKYIKSIDIIVPDDSQPLRQVEGASELKEIINLAKNKNIPVRVYSRDNTNYILTSKNQLLNFEIENVTNKAKEKPKPKDTDSTTTPYIIVNTIRELVKAKSINDLNETDRLRLNWVIVNADDAIMQWREHVNTYFSPRYGKSGQGRKNFEEIVEYMRKHGISDFAGLIYNIKDKFTTK